MNKVLFLLLLILLVANIAATLVVTKSSSEKKQKGLQLLFIWLVPIVGALLAWFLLREEKTEYITTDFSDRYGSDDGELRNRDANSAESSSQNSGSGD